jgi:GNAT superfamily N-acetyltransferase
MSAARPSGRWFIAALDAARWPDLVRLFGEHGACAGCWCMWARRTAGEFRAGKGAGNRRALRRLAGSDESPGLLAYRGAEPVAWAALGPRAAYRRLAGSRVLAPVDETEVWSVPCFFVRRDQRGLGLTVRLLRAAARQASRSGARVLEGYPLDLSGARTAPAFAWWGLRPAFEAAGFCEVARRSPTRPIMRRLLRRGARRG